MTDKEEMNVQDENSIIAERRSKLAEIRSLGHAFPNNFTPEDFAKKLHALYENDEKADLEQKNIHVVVAGRMMLKRVMGKASFATIQDKSGRIQLYVARDNINSDKNPELYSQIGRAHV